MIMYIIYMTLGGPLFLKCNSIFNEIGVSADLTSEQSFKLGVQ